MDGNKQIAVDYAQKAFIAWAQHFSVCNDYYNSYVHYAYALAILGKNQEMMVALHKSAALIKKDFDYHEFKNLLAWVEKVKKEGLL